MKYGALGVILASLLVGCGDAAEQPEDEVFDDDDSASDDDDAVDGDDSTTDDDDLSLDDDDTAPPVRRLPRVAAGPDRRQDLAPRRRAA